MSPAIKARSTGFTLIELLVVIFIISILIAATLTIVPKVKRAVYGTQTQAQLSAIAAAIQQYYNDFKAYPGPLPNNQLVTGDDIGTPVIPYVTDPTNGTLQLNGTAPTSPAYTDMDYVPTPFQPTFITSSQNLVLGLLGGLELVMDPSNPGAAKYFVYNPQDIFSDGVNPSPKGAASLNITNPKRQQPYIQIKSGDLSIPSIKYNSGSGASFVDASGDLNASDKRSPQDAMIPVFLDKFSNPLPILYYRTNVSGTAIVGFRGQTTYKGTTNLQDSVLLAKYGSAPNETPQYDLVQNLPYVTSRIGTIGDGSSNPYSVHGLQGITDASNSNQLLVSSSTPPSPPVDTIDYLVNGQYTPTGTNTTKGCNGLAYFKDPTLNSTTYDSTTNAASNTHLGVARQKDGYILISAGPDGLYGTHDDLVFPGPLQP